MSSKYGTDNSREHELREEMGGEEGGYTGGEKDSIEGVGVRKTLPSFSASAASIHVLRNVRNQEILLRVACFCPGLSNTQSSNCKLLETAL